TVSSFVKDPAQKETDDILKGGTKDDNDINADPANPGGTSSDLAWTSAKPSPPKNDITDAYAAEYVCKTSAGCTANDTVLEGDRLRGRLYRSRQRASAWRHEDVQSRPPQRCWHDMRGRRSRHPLSDHERNERCQVALARPLIERDGQPDPTQQRLRGRHRSD